jgi:hypothetical protein
MDMARPHEEQKRMFSADTDPQPEQVTMQKDCNAKPLDPILLIWEAKPKTRA